MDENSINILETSRAKAIEHSENLGPNLGNLRYVIHVVSDSKTNLHDEVRATFGDLPELIVRCDHTTGNYRNNIKADHLQIRIGPGAFLFSQSQIKPNDLVVQIMNSAINNIYAKYTFVVPYESLPLDNNYQEIVSVIKSEISRLEDL